MDLAEALIFEHKNPKVRLPLIRTKKFIPANEVEARAIEQLDVLRSTLLSNRVEKCSVRSKLVWLEKERLAYSTKMVGAVGNHFGRKDGDCKFFTPEEVLFLLETNKVELMWNDVALSLEQAFAVLDVDLKKYRAFRQLALQGYKLTKIQDEEYKVNGKGREITESKTQLPLIEFADRQVKRESETKLLEDNNGISRDSNEISVNDGEVSEDEPLEKKVKLNGGKQNSDNGQQIDEYRKEVFERLKRLAPKPNKKKIRNPYGYTIQPPDKKDNFNLRLFGPKLDEKMGFYGGDVANIYYMSEGDSSSYFKCCEFTVPDLN